MMPVQWGFKFPSQSLARCQPRSRWLSFKFTAVMIIASGREPSLSPTVTAWPRPAGGRSPQGLLRSRLVRPEPGLAGGRRGRGHRRRAPGGQSPAAIVCR